MKKFKAILFKTLPNAAHFNFCSQVSIHVSGAGAAVLSALGDVPAQFNAWLNKEAALMEWVRKSILTDQISEADHRMDQALVALKAQVRAQEYSPVPERVQTAHDLNLMLKNYGRVYLKPYEAEEGDVRTILVQLQGTYLQDVQLLDLYPYVNELNVAYEAFRQLLAQRDAKSVQKPAENFPTVRRGIETEYHRLATLVDAGAALNTSPDFAALIDKLNPEIDRLNTEFHHARKDIGVGEACVVEPIPTQPYTGKSVTVLPKAYYRTEGKPTVELVFAKDFSVTYKNNVDVGTADLTLHGKGAYKGQKTITFNIAR
jgi:hypothetical protein